MNGDIKYTPWKVFIWFVTISSIIVATIGGFALSAQSNVGTALSNAQMNTQEIKSQKEYNTERFNDIKSSLNRIETKLDKIK